MAKYELRGHWFTPKELSDMSGVPAHTIRDRLRRGYSVEESIKTTALQDSVKAFSDASHWEDWIGVSISGLFEIYWKWCVSHGYTPLSKQGFSRQLMSMHPMLKIVPIKKGDKYHRVIRVRANYGNDF